MAMVQPKTPRMDLSLITNKGILLIVGYRRLPRVPVEVTRGLRKHKNRVGSKATITAYRGQGRLPLAARVSAMGRKPALSTSSPRPGQIWTLLAAEGAARLTG